MREPGQPGEDGARAPSARPTRPSDRNAAAARIRHQETWVDLQVRQAMERGDFDDLPGYGKPLEGLGDRHDPDWWVKRLIEREQITGVLPPSLQLRREDAELDDRLDRLPSAADVRRAVEEFNERVRWALYRPPEGPPMVTVRRDPDAEVVRWEQRREARRQQRDQRRGERVPTVPDSYPRRMLARLRRRPSRGGPDAPGSGV